MTDNMIYNQKQIATAVLDAVHAILMTPHDTAERIARRTVANLRNHHPQTVTKFKVTRVRGFGADMAPTALFGSLEAVDAWLDKRPVWMRKFYNLETLLVNQ